MYVYDIYDKYVACPFYVALRTDLTIQCEGVTNDCLSVKLFEDTGEMKRWFSSRCCKNPESCPVYNGIIRAKYEACPSPPLRIPKKIYK